MPFPEHLFRFFALQHGDDVLCTEPIAAFFDAAVNATHQLFGVFRRVDHLRRFHAVVAVTAIFGRFFPEVIEDHAPTTVHGFRQSQHRIEFSRTSALINFIRVALLDKAELIHHVL